MLDLPAVGPEPEHFSGTGCRISAHAHVTPGTLGFRQAELRIGGKVAYFGTRPIPDDGVWEANWNVYVMFDSTQLPPTGDATVLWTVWDNNMFPWVTSISVPVKNRFATYGRRDFDVEPWTWTFNGSTDPPLWFWFQGDWTWASVDTVDSKMAAMNWSRFDKCTASNWGHVRANTGVANAECLYYSSHGNHDADGFLLLTDTDDAVNFYEPGNNFPSLPYDDELQTILRDTLSSSYEYPVRPVVQTKVGTGMPPFNDGGPPVSLVFLMACCCATTNSPAEAYLWPYRNAYQPPGSPEENKAAVGWDAPFSAYGVGFVAYVFYENLRLGCTVDEARDSAQEAYDSSPWSAASPASLKVWGDFHTRTNYLYTGSSGPRLYPRPFARLTLAYTVFP